MTDFTELKRLANAATPGRVHDRLDSCGGGLKYTCTGEDGSVVLVVDHKNDKFGFIGDNHEADEKFFLKCTPAAVLALIAENEKLKEDLREVKDAKLGLSWAIGEIMREGDQLKAENEALRKDAERYRFIRDADRSDGILDVDDLGLYAMESLDEVVDEAISREGEVRQ